jgi:hypothetical protein
MLGAKVEQAQDLMSIARCWPVTQIVELTEGSASSALIRGAILMASGRVPKIERIFIEERPYCPAAAVHAARGERFKPAAVGRSAGMLAKMEYSARERR